MASDQITTLLPLGGMCPSGDPDFLPPGMTRLMENAAFRPGRVEKRPAFIYESVAGVRGFGNWLDAANGVERLVVAVTGGDTVDLRLQAADSESIAAAVEGFNTPGYMSDFCNYRGLFYYCVTTGLSASAVPLALHSFDGTTITQYPLGGETLSALVIKPFGDRLFLWNVRATIDNQLGSTAAYDGTAWTAELATVTNIASGGASTCRLMPTNATGAKLYKANVYTVAASATDTTLIFRSDLRSTSPTYPLPMTLDVYYSQAWVAATAYSLGAIRVPTAAGGNGLRYRVTAAGTSHGATEPTWPTTVGATVVDNGVTWTCDGPDTIGTALTATLPTLSEKGKPLPYFVRAVVPANAVSADIGVRIKFGNPATPTLATLAAVDISFRDGKSDGDLNKQNYGQQLTIGRFVYPFFNQEGSATVTISLDNDGYFTETSDPSQILGNSYQRLSDLPGKVTAAAIVGGRQVVFKRRGMWVFQLGTDPVNPLVRERFFSNYGCVGPRALWVFEDTLYFVGENEVYRWRPGGEPEPIGGDAMREEIMARGQWLENIGGDPVDVSQIIGITVDEARRDLLVATQQRVIHCYDIPNPGKDSIGWTRWTATATDYAPQLVCPIWNTNRRHVYLAEDGQYVTRADDDVTGDSLQAADAVNEETIIVKPLPREEIALDAVWLHHMSSTSQELDDDGIASTLTVYVSLDSGATWTVNAGPLTLGRVSVAGAKLKTKIPIRTNGPGMLIKFVHSGRSSNGAFSLTGIEPVFRPKGAAERNRTQVVNA